MGSGSAHRSTSDDSSTGFAHHSEAVRATTRQSGPPQPACNRPGRPCPTPYSMALTYPSAIRQGFVTQGLHPQWWVFSQCGGELIDVINPLPRYCDHRDALRLFPARCVPMQGHGGSGPWTLPNCAADPEANVGACPRCAIPTPVREGACPACQVAPPPYARAVVPYLYVPPLTRLIHGLKHGNGLIEARILATLMRDALASDDPPNLILPVPLTYRRRVQRGYNQAALLAAPNRAPGRRASGFPGGTLSASATPPARSLDATPADATLSGAYGATDSRERT